MADRRKLSVASATASSMMPPKRAMIREGRAKMMTRMRMRMRMRRMRRMSGVLAVNVPATNLLLMMT